MTKLKEFYTVLFDISLSPYRLVTEEWNGSEDLLHFISNILIVLALVGILIIILSFINKSKKVFLFKNTFLLFGAFVMLLGFSLFTETVIPWLADFPLSAILRFLAALVSIVTLFALHKAISDIFSLRNSAQINHELEQIKNAEESLKIKNDEIIQVIKDLEYFTYAVSHDLRAPLRAISSYSNFLKEENYEQLNEKAKIYIDNVISSAKKMETLIADLLRFSTISQKGLVYAPVNINALALEVVENIKKEYPNDYDVKIDPLPMVNADSALIKQLLENLVSNAFKYAHKKDKPEIHIGTIEHHSSRAIFIKDNGIGFNMKYYYKIFQVFQRLHSEEEFKGTGVGMAIAKKIVEKYGGEIWAESKHNEGAVFYFCIPDKA
jgi:two-component system, chemotaxis family, sensor kinase Cph1